MWLSGWIWLVIWNIGLLNLHNLNWNLYFMLIEICSEIMNILLLWCNFTYLNAVWSMKEWVWFIAHPPKKSLEPQQLLLQQGCYETAPQAHSSYICYIRSLLVLTLAHIVKKENRIFEISMTLMLMSEFIVVIYIFFITLVCENRINLPSLSWVFPRICQLFSF